MLEDIINYKFLDSNLLDLALTHSSVKNEHGDNERLEFLGDRVLGLSIADILFRKFELEEEGELAKRHTALVQQSALVVVAEKINLVSYIKLSSSEKKSGDRSKKAILADGVEAIIAAIYLDGGFYKSYEFISMFWAEMIDNQENPPEDAKSKLQEWAQARTLSLPKYTVVDRSGSDHEPQFEIEVVVETVGKARAIAGSKSKAEKQAAVKLLEIIEGK